MNICHFHIKMNIRKKPPFFWCFFFAPSDLEEGCAAASRHQIHNWRKPNVKLFSQFCLALNNFESKRSCGVCMTVCAGITA